MDAHVKPKVTSLMIPASHTSRGNEYSYRYQNACFRQISQCARPMLPVPCTRCRTPTPASLHVSLIDFDIRAADRLRTAQANVHSMNI